MEMRRVSLLLLWMGKWRGMNRPSIFAPESTQIQHVKVISALVLAFWARSIVVVIGLRGGSRCMKNKLEGFTGPVGADRK
jgi:hypothetical protein